MKSSSLIKYKPPEGNLGITNGDVPLWGFGLIVFILFILFTHIYEIDVVFYFIVFLALLLFAPLLLLFTSSPFYVLLSLILFLPLHALMMSFLMAFTSLSPEILRLIAGWKEYIIIISFLLCTLKILSKGKDIEWTVSDGLGLIYLAIVIPTVFYPTYIYPNAPEFIKKLYGLRDVVFFMLIYYLGRFARLTDREAGIILWALLWVGFIASLAGFLERFFLPEDIYIKIGYIQYINWLGLEFAGAEGLPENLFVSIGGIPVRRLASFYLMSQVFAQAMIVIFPAIIYLTSIANSARRTRLKWVLFIVLIAQLLTISRMPILAVTVGLLVGGRMLRDRFIFRLGLVIFVMMTILGIISGLLSTSETSFAGHLTVLEEGIENITASPFLGEGPGTSGIASVKDLGSGIAFSIGGPEGQYTALGVQFGLPALLINIAFLISVIIESVRGFRVQFDWRSRGICLIAGVAGIGFMLNSITTCSYGVTYLTFIYFWIAGLAIQKSIDDRKLRRAYCKEKNING